MNLSLTQLRYIVAVANQGSFGAAAKICHVTQPTLSMQIQKAEEQLDVMLFDRSKQPVVPTTIGTKLIEQCRVVLREAERLLELVKDEAGQIQGSFRLGMIPTVAPYLLPMFVKAFVDHYPGVSLTVEELETHQLVRRLKDDTIDAGILATPLKDQTLAENPLYYEPFFVCFHKDDPLSQRERLSEKDLPLERVLLLNEGNCLRDQMINLCRHKATVAASDSGLHFESGSLSTLLSLVERGQGFTIVPYLALDSVTHRKLVTLPFIEPAPAREISLVVHRSYAKHNILDALRAEILASLPAELASLANKGDVRRIDFEWK